MRLCRYIHVSLMIFVGFGWLMTFLRRYAYSAVGLNFLLSCVCILEYSLVGGAIQQGPIGAGGAWNSVRYEGILCPRQGRSSLLPKSTALVVF